MPNSEEVDRWFTELDHPKKDLMLEVRKTILEADERVHEAIELKSPTFLFSGTFAIIVPQALEQVRIAFPRGGDIPGEFPTLEDGGSLARSMRFEDQSDLDRRAGELQALVRAWCELKAL